MTEDLTTVPVVHDPGAFVDQVAMEEDTAVLFDGDKGQLPYEARRAFALLLRSRYLSAADNPGEWRALLAHQDVLESRCHDLFLQLVVDRDYELAYKTQVREDGLAVPILLKDEPYKRVETLMMVHLRNAFRQQQGAGERVAFIDAEELVEYALSYLAQDETNLAARRREADNAIATLVREHVLDEVGEGRYRILPVIEVLLPVDRLHELARWLRNPAGTDDAAADPGADVALGEGDVEEDADDAAPDDAADEAAPSSADAPADAPDAPHDDAEEALL